MVSNDAHRRRLFHNGYVGTSFLSWIRLQVDARLVLFIRQYSLKRTVVRDGDQEKALGSDDLEKAITSGGSNAIVQDETPVLKSNADEEDDDIKTVREKRSIEEVNDYEQVRPATASTAV